MAIAAVSDLFAKCTPAFGLGSSRCGGLTLLDISPTTTDELDSIYLDGSDRYRIIGALLESDFMGNACQVRQNSLYDYLRSTARQWGTKKIGSQSTGTGTYEVRPFVIESRKGPINNNFWNVTSGSDTAGISPGGEDYDYTATLTSQTDIPADLRWFPARTEVYISGRSAAGSATRTQWKVVDAVVASATAITVYFTSVNSASSLDADKLEAPVTGVATRGVTNVNSYEAYCAQIPGINPNQRAFYWLQETRWSMCFDEMTEQYLTMLREGNPLFREFGDVPLVEENRQIVEDFQRRQVESFFWNKPLANQTPTGYDQLEVITAGNDETATDFLILPDLQGRQIARRANAIGVYEQLAECGRVYDLQGEVLNLVEFFNQLYAINRVRKDNGITSRVIEVVTDTAYAVQLRQGIFRYLNARMEDKLRVTMEVGMPANKVSPTGFYYTDFELDYPMGVTLRIVTHEAFDDLLSAHVAGSINSEVGRMLLVLDIGNTIYQAIIQSDSVSLQTGDIKTRAQINQDDFCRMRVPKKSIKHNSLVFTNVVSCPAASLWIENIDAGIPEHLGVSAGDTNDLAGVAA